MYRLIVIYQIAVNALRPRRYAAGVIDIGEVPMRELNELMQAIVMILVLVLFLFYWAVDWGEEPEECAARVPARSLRPGDVRGPTVIESDRAIVGYDAGTIDPED